MLKGRIGTCDAGRAGKKHVRESATMTPNPLHYARLRSAHLAARRALAEADRRARGKRRVAAWVEAVGNETETKRK